MPLISAGGVADSTGISGGRSVAFRVGNLYRGLCVRHVGLIDLVNTVILVIIVIIVILVLVCMASF